MDKSNEDWPPLPLTPPPPPPTEPPPLYIQHPLNPFASRFLSVLQSNISFPIPIVIRSSYLLHKDVNEPSIDKSLSSARRDETVWIANLPNSFHSYHLFHDFCIFGEIESINSFETKHYVFINFVDCQSAALAIDFIVSLRSSHQQSPPSSQTLFSSSIQTSSSLPPVLQQALLHHSVLVSHGTASPAECMVKAGYIDFALVSAELNGTVQTVSDKSGPKATRTLWLPGFAHGWPVTTTILQKAFSIFGAVEAVRMGAHNRSVHVAFFTRIDAVVARLALRDLAFGDKPIAVEYTHKQLQSPNQTLSRSPSPTSFSPSPTTTPTPSVSVHSAGYHAVPSFPFTFQSSPILPQPQQFLVSPTNSPLLPYPYYYPSPQLSQSQVISQLPPSSPTLPASVPSPLLTPPLVQHPGMILHPYIYSASQSPTFQSAYQSVSPVSTPPLPSPQLHVPPPSTQPSLSVPPVMHPFPPPSAAPPPAHSTASEGITASTQEDSDDIFLERSLLIPWNNKQTTPK